MKENHPRGTGRGGERARRIAELQPWFHNLHLPDGSQTAPEHFLGDFPAYKWAEIAPFLPEDMSGWSALDIGCNAGFYSIELARRGARVTAIDLNAHYLKQARWAAAEFGLEGRITFRRMQIYDLARTSAVYDLVLFLGVFYHLRYPLLGLDITVRKTGRQLIFQTLTMPGDEPLTVVQDLPLDGRQQLLHPGWPKMAFIEHSLADDPTNWWAANDAGVQAMLRSSGLKVIARPGAEIYLCEPDPDHPSCTTTWDREEYEAATGRRRRPAAGARAMRPGHLRSHQTGSHAFNCLRGTEVL
jgi:tRNA (mo5U34)-methyltransferase